jgi:hypothetical protein
MNGGANSVNGAAPALVGTTTAVTLTSGINPSTYGNSVSFRATVTPTSGGPPTGPVQFKDGGVNIGSPVTLVASGSNGVADFILPWPTHGWLNVGVHLITAFYAGDVSFDASDSSGLPLSHTVTQRPLTVSATGINKVYDGTTVATFILYDNRVSGDVLTINYSSASFANKNVGTGKTVSVSGITVSGIDAGNYTFNTTASTTANITAKPITVTAVTSTKPYDGNITSAGLPTITVGGPLVGTDTVTWTQTYNNKNVGTLKTLTPAGTVNDGNGGLNYAVTFVTNNTGVINAISLALTVTATGIDKVYDGTTFASVILSDNRLPGDVLIINYTSSFADKNVGTGKTVSVSGITVSGIDAGNYTFSTTTASTTASITIRAITVTAGSDTKAYDGTTTSAYVPRITSGSLATGDTAIWVQNFNNPSVGVGKIMIPSGILSDGNQGRNYAVTFVTNNTGVITGTTTTTTAPPTTTTTPPPTTTTTTPPTTTTTPPPTTTTTTPPTTIAISKIVFITGAQTRTAGTVSGVMSIQAQDASGNPVNVTTNTTINLTSSSANGKFYSDAAGTSQITSVTISSGSSTVSFYYKDSSAGTPTITVAESPSAGWTDATQQETITATTPPTTSTTTPPPPPSGLDWFLIFGWSIIGLLLLGILIAIFASRRERRES